MYEALVARVRYHIQKANFMGLKEAESTLLLGEAADALEELAKESERWQAEAKDWYLAYMDLLPTRWIPVTERLPKDDDKRFLVCAKRFNGEPYMYICYHAKNLHEFDEYDFPNENRPGWYFYDSEYGWIEKEDVTHWMPLPEPPKEG